jgi:hypothetical protein
LAHKWSAPATQNTDITRQLLRKSVKDVPLIAAASFMTAPQCWWGQMTVTNTVGSYIASTCTILQQIRQSIIGIMHVRACPKLHDSPAVLVGAYDGG